jgi:hypothetical protein
MRPEVGFGSPRYAGPLRRWWLSLTCAVGIAGCGDVSAPVLPASSPSLQGGPAGIHILHQGVNSPKLETYRLAFWMVKGRGKSVAVNYLPAAGAVSGEPFLRFQIPSGGLEAGPRGRPLRNGDSVLVSLTIDPTTFQVGFEPSGLQFSRGNPASLQIWFHHADPDLNGDGVVDAIDEALCQQLSFWYQLRPGQPWQPMASQRDLVGMSVSTALYHFSGYSVSW